MSRIRAGIRKNPTILAIKLLLDEIRRKRRNKKSATNFNVVEKRIVSLKNSE
jgi:hypothetical protein